MVVIIRVIVIWEMILGIILAIRSMMATAKALETMIGSGALGPVLDRALKDPASFSMGIACGFTGGLIIKDPTIQGTVL